MVNLKDNHHLIEKKDLMHSILLRNIEGLAEAAQESIPPQGNSYFIEALERAKAEPRERIHSFHRYFGKLIPAIPRFALREFTRPGGVCLDPFCGSGTTLVEATLAGCDCWGTDLNPLSALVANAKTTVFPAEALKRRLVEVCATAEGDDGRDLDKDIPFCLNMDHWFRREVVHDLARLLRAINKLPEGPERGFFRACFSAVLRDVSNADPRHVFPGYSKRLRVLDAAGKRQIRVLEQFREDTTRRLRALEGYQARRAPSARSMALLGDARRLPNEIPSAAVDLVVTNPPYLGSIRYLETLKLEMYWLGFLEGRDSYLSLDRQVVATERFHKPEFEEWHATGIPQADMMTWLLFERGHKRMSRVAARYFEDMASFLNEMARVVRQGGHLVIKISDSFIRGLRVPTHAILLQLAVGRGFSALAAFPDEIKNRSLLTKRNSYSKMLEHDCILVLQRR